VYSASLLAGMACGCRVYAFRWCPWCHPADLGSSISFSTPRPFNGCRAMGCFASSVHPKDGAPATRTAAAAGTCCAAPYRACSGRRYWARARTRRALCEVWRRAAVGQKCSVSGSPRPHAPAPTPNSHSALMSAPARHPSTLPFVFCASACGPAAASSGTPAEGGAAASGTPQSVPATPAAAASPANESTEASPCHNSASDRYKVQGEALSLLCACM
jgi:hypothetical protein